jgi:5'-nucleotidase
MVSEVIISDVKRYERIKEEIKKGGMENFHVIADFDRTITYGLDREGKKTTTVISQLRKKPEYLGQKYFDESHKLFDMYHPIEIDNSLPLENKKDKMREWWSKHFDLLVESGLSQDLIKKVAQENPLNFRKNSLEFFSFLTENKIPILVISAGPGDLMEEYFKQNNMDFPNVYIVGNRYDFDKFGKAISIKGPIIHTFNKTEVTLENTPFYKKIKNRKNVLLLGDSIGDIGMIEGFDYNHLLKIGFLNEEVKKNLQIYKENFDIVITNDGDFDFVKDLVGELK